VFELNAATVGPWLAEQKLVEPDAELEVEELAGGVSATVLAVRGADRPIVVKQALPRLRVADEWLAAPRRTATEAEAMRLCGALTPGVVPAVLAFDRERNVLAMELVEGLRNWQAEVELGSAHAELGAWAGRVLATWHRRTAAMGELAARFPDFESFEEQRLRPFHETVMERRPDLVDAIAPYRDSLRSERRCLVHGDYAMKNMLVGGRGGRVLDFEVAHVGNPLFDLGFFLSFVVLSAVRWPTRTDAMRALAEAFLAAYENELGSRPAQDVVAGHTACLVLARTDGTSIALFLDERSRAAARDIGVTLLKAPERGLWSWL
jgi:5-methylthioribose kinase